MWKRLKPCEKDDLLKLAEHLKLSVTRQTKKAEIRNVVCEALVKEGVLLRAEMIQEREGDRKEMSDHEFELEMKKLELMREREEREFKLREMEIEREIRLAEVKNLSHRKESETEVVRNIKLVPKFNEKDVEKFFLHFEKVAENMGWSKAIWPMLLQSVLTGKAQEVYSALSIEQSGDYDVVKSTVLQAYELVPEAYRQRFRNKRKEVDQTHVEFAREKETLFDRWCSSNEVGSDFDKLRELMLLEEFKDSVRKEVKIHLDEQKVASLRQAAKMADDYELTHKQSFVRNPGYAYNRGYQDNKVYNPSQGKGCNPGRENRDQKGSDVSAKAAKKVEQKEGLEQKFFRVPTCYHCKKKGHVMSDCWFLKKQGETKRSAVNLVSCKAPLQMESLVKGVEGSQVKRDPKGCFDSFMSCGSVSVKEQGEKKPIVILRDTGASQTLLSADVLPMGQESSEKAHVLVRGVEGDYKPVPLYEIYLESDLVTGPVSVAVVNQIPVEGVKMLLGNDLAGDRVKANPHVISEPSTLDDTEFQRQENPEIYHACVVTRSMAMKEKQEEEKEANEIELADTFLSKVEDCGENAIQVSERSNEERKSEESDKELEGKEYLPL